VSEILAEYAQETIKNQYRGKDYTVKDILNCFKTLKKRGLCLIAKRFSKNIKMTLLTVDEQGHITAMSQ